MDITKMNGSGSRMGGATVGQWEPMFITTDTGVFECFSAGQGRPLCTTHLYQAFTRDGNRFADILAAYYHVIAVNLRGAGNSPKPRRKSELTLHASLQDLENIRQALSYDTWSYAGHSTGGFAGLKYVTTYPKSLDSLILSGTAASRHFQDSRTCIYNFRNGYHRKEMTQLWFSMMMPFVSRRAKQMARRRLIELSLFRPERYDEYFATGPKAGSGIVSKRMRAYIRGLKTYDVRGELPDVDTPTLVLCGAHDVQCPIENSYEIHSLMKNAQFIVFDESNHFPFVEEPDDFRRAIESFARQN